MLNSCCNFLHSFSFFFNSWAEAWFFLLPWLLKPFLFIISANLFTACSFFIFSSIRLFFNFSISSDATGFACMLRRSITKILHSKQLSHTNTEIEINLTVKALFHYPLQINICILLSFSTNLQNNINFLMDTDAPSFPPVSLPHIHSELCDKRNSRMEGHG